MMGFKHLKKFVRPKPQIFVTLGDDGIITVPFHIQGAAPFFTPSDHPGGIVEIMDFIAGHPNAAVTLILDHLAQDYRADTLPPLNGFDRPALIARRMKQNFPHARLTAYLRRRSPRDTVTLIGIHEKNSVFGRCERLSPRMPSILLLPLEGARLAAPLNGGDKSGWQMIISRHKTGGFRQIVTLNGDFIFTRLTPLMVAITPSADAVAEIIARDIRASLDYLTRHGLHQAGDLSVILLLNGDSVHQPALAALGLKKIITLSPANAAEILSLPFSPSRDSEDSDLLFTAAMASRRPLLRLRTAEIKRVWINQTLRGYGLRFGVVMLAVSLLSLAIAAYDVARLMVRHATQQQILAQTQQQLREIQSQAAPVTEPLGRLRQAVERGRLFAKETTQPWRVLNKIIHAMPHDVLPVKCDWLKDSDTAVESVTLSLQPVPTQADATHADVVALFTRAAGELAQAMPDYALSITRTPYPDLAQDQVTTTVATGSSQTSLPVGEIYFEKKNHD